LDHPGKENSMVHFVCAGMVIVLFHMPALVPANSPVMAAPESKPRASGPPTPWRPPPAPAPQAQPEAAGISQPVLRRLFCAGTSTTADVPSIETGGHDPAQRGFTVQNTEMVLEGAVDPYFRAQANLVFQLDENGETVSELEEAYLISSSLPHNLQLKAGTYFTEFG
jgi:hypothetical protein